MAADAQAGGFGKKRNHFSPTRLGHLPPTLLGHSDPGNLLRKRRHGGGPRQRPAGNSAAQSQTDRRRRVPAGRHARIREYARVQNVAAPLNAKPTPWTRSSIQSWYFYRYCDPHNSQAPFDSAKVKYWFPIDQYIGGITHAILHLLYSRFWCKVMRDLGLIDHTEPSAASSPKAWCKRAA